MNFTVEYCKWKLKSKWTLTLRLQTRIVNSATASQVVSPWDPFLLNHILLLSLLSLSNLCTLGVFMLDKIALLLDVKWNYMCFLSLIWLWNKIQWTLVIVNAWIVNNLSLVNIFGETGRLFYNIKTTCKHLSIVNKIGDKTEFTITRVHCI